MQDFKKMLGRHQIHYKSLLARSHRIIFHYLFESDLFFENKNMIRLKLSLFLTSKVFTK